MIKDLLDIIIPAYYEQENIEKVIGQIKKNVKTPNKITVVLQDKLDPTINVLKTLQKNISNLNVLFTKDGIGIIKALKEGLNYTKAPIIVIVMADLSDDINDIDKMVAEINKGNDLVCASRYSNPGKRIGGQKIKGLLSYLACKSLQFIMRLPTSDATNAFKCFRRSLIQEILVESQEGYEFPLELTVKSFKKGKKISELPTIWKDRKKGASKFSFFHLLPLYLRWYFYGIFVK